MYTLYLYIKISIKYIKNIYILKCIFYKVYMSKSIHLCYLNLYIFVLI